MKLLFVCVVVLAMVIGSMSQNIPNSVYIRRSGGFAGRQKDYGQNFRPDYPAYDVYEFNAQVDNPSKSFAWNQEATKPNICHLFEELVERYGRQL
ncbi:hypothetical protein DFA_03562 [Cavenderia fasciculata]|uniref:Uncharacterized protein n=1 Tax=Cavenderia fasciculata TaxID=261658 RepID=F4PI30_CACFS|nr:uncharacterized protein DFA_03562 [Cavenderia fasciculata]EGG25313.1 hypothetical protein DFA_03562 [Cavenderia fasciculata]|eukprot:XP_004363164.1 hypothetical protein DFA_03562 [Cavenderia fasciculata]